MSRFSSLIKSFTDKPKVLQWVPHWLRFFPMHFYVILKNSGSQNEPLIFYPKSLKDILMIFCNVPLSIIFNDFLNYMNNKHPNIKFTSEFDKYGSFSFLNVTITRSSKQLVTSAFCNATFKGVFTSS